MVVEDKIQDAKDCFAELEKKGYNGYQKFKYIELKELNPLVRNVCKKFKIRTNFEWDVENNLMHLHVTDREDGSKYTASIPVAPVTAADPGKYMQDVGRVQTYSQRYLYVQVFEIAVPDEIDNKDQNGSKSVPEKYQKCTKSVPKQKQTPKKKQNIPVQPVIEPKTEEVTEQDIKEALDKTYDIIVNQGGKEFTVDGAKFQLERIYKNKPQLVKACLNSLQINSAGDKKQ